MRTDDGDQMEIYLFIQNEFRMILLEYFFLHYYDTKKVADK